MASSSSSNSSLPSQTTSFSKSPSPPLTVASPSTNPDSELAAVIRPYSTNPYPAWSLASVFLASSFLSPHRYPHMPHLAQRIGFSFIMSGAGYVVFTGDVRNGSGISTAWTMAYLFWNARTSFTRPRNPASMFLTVATAACSCLYGTEYFVLQS